MDWDWDGLDLRVCGGIEHLTVLIRRGASARENTQNIKKISKNSDLSDIGAFPQLLQ